MWGTDWTRAVASLTYQQGVEAFRVTDRLSDSDRAALMGGDFAAGLQMVALQADVTARLLGVAFADHGRPVRPGRPAREVRHDQCDGTPGRRPHAVQLHQRAGRVPLGAAAVPGGEIAADRGAAADGDRGGLGARELARAQPAARPRPASTSRRPTAARVSASSSSASCWRRWAGPCSARPISPPPCWPRPRS